MKKIDLAKILQCYKLDATEVATLLFPTNTHAGLALKRVMGGKGLLDADQIAKLAFFLNVSIDDLYADQWAHSERGERLHRFENGDYFAELDPITWVTKVYHKNSLLHETVLHAGTVTLTEYFKQLNLIIKNFKDEFSTD